MTAGGSGGNDFIPPSLAFVAVIPVLNEQGAIGVTLRRLPVGVRAIVVDGGSRDGTVAEARAAGAEVIVERRRGYGQACQTGAERARALGAEVVLFLDGDGADAVEEVGRVVGPILAGEADFVLATRHSHLREPGSMGLHQVLAGRAVGAAVGVLTGVRYTDMGALRAIRSADLSRLELREMTYGWNLEMQIRAARLGLRVIEVPLPYYRRVAGRSKVAGNLTGGLRAAVRILATLARTARR